MLWLDPYGVEDGAHLGDVFRGQFRGPVRGLLASQVLQGSEAKGLVTARCRLPSPAGTSEDAAVEVLEARTRRRRTASRHRPAPEAIKAVLVEEFRRS
jgi:hypothetical protein